MNSSDSSVSGAKSKLTPYEDGLASGVSAL
jgi:hypothetical protein